MDEGRALQRALSPPFAERFLFSGRTGPPPSRGHATRLEPSPPGGCWQGNRPQREPVFFGKAPLRGPGESTARKGLRARNEPPLLPFDEGRIHIIGTGIVIVFAFHTDFFLSNVSEFTSPFSFSGKKSVLGWSGQTCWPRSRPRQEVGSGLVHGQGWSPPFAACAGLDKQVVRSTQDSGSYSKMPCQSPLVWRPFSRPPHQQRPLPSKGWWRPTRSIEKRNLSP